MGAFVSAVQIKARATVPLLRQMEPQDIDDLYIYPAERLIEEAFNLDLNTDAIPSYFEARFERAPSLQTQFETDMRRAVTLLVNRMAVNPHGMGSQTVRGFSASYGPLIPETVRALLRRWGRPKQVFRS